MDPIFFQRLKEFSTAQDFPSLSLSLALTIKSSNHSISTIPTDPFPDFRNLHSVCSREFHVREEKLPQNLGKEHLHLKDVKENSSPQWFFLVFKAITSWKFTSGFHPWNSMDSSLSKERFAAHPHRRRIPKCYFCEPRGETPERDGNDILHRSHQRNSCNSLSWLKKKKKQTQDNSFAAGKVKWSERRKILKSRSSRRKRRGFQNRRFQRRKR